MREHVPDETAFVLVIDEIQGIVGPHFFDLLDIFFERHLSPKSATNRGGPENI